MGELFRAIIKVGSGSLVSMFMSAVMMKLIAVFFGPSGVGLFSIYRQIQQLFISIATLSGNTAIVQGISSRDETESNIYIATIGKVFIFTVLLTIVLYVYFAGHLFNIFFSDQKSITLEFFLLCLIPSVLSCLSVFLLSILNGCRKIGAVAIQQMVGTSAAALFVYPYSLFFNENHIYIIVAISFLFSMLTSLYFFSKYKLIYKLKFVFNSCWDISSFKAFASIAIGSLLVGASGAATLFYVRLTVLKNGGLTDAGLFDSAWSISMTYVVLLLGAFSTYYLPKISSIVDIDERNELISLVLKLASILSMILVSLVIIFKPLIIVILYSESFSPSLNLMQWMLIGDYIKVLGWVLSIPLIAYMRTFMYVFISTIFNVIILISLYCFSNTEVSDWFGKAYIFANCIYVMALVVYWFGFNKLKVPLKTTFKWFICFFAILIFSKLHWGDLVLNYKQVVFSLMGLVLFSLSMIGKKDIVKFYCKVSLTLSRVK